MTSSSLDSADQRTQADLWRAAIKAPMYTVAIIPILVGSATAYADSGVLDIPTFLAFLLAAICIIAWLNCTNDVFDYDTGIDVNKKESIVNLCGASRQARQTVFMVANIFLAVGFVALYWLSAVPSFDPTVLVIITTAVFWGYAYQGPPFRLGYYGLGEPICFATWFMSTIAAYYSQVRLDKNVMRELLQIASSVNSIENPDLASRMHASFAFLGNRLFEWSQFHIMAAAFFVASVTATILFCSHFHQIIDDRKAGKLSPIVRLGTFRASQVLQVVIVGLYVFHLTCWVSGALPPAPSLAVVASLPHGHQLAKFVRENHALQNRVRVAKYFAVRLHFVHGILLSAGLFATGYMKYGTR